MEREFNITNRRSVGNLHIRLSGEFNGMCAWELIKTMKLRNSGPGRIFVDTTGLNSVTAEGVEAFRSYVAINRIRPGTLYFKGEKGFEIASDGARVIVCNRRSSRQGLPLKTLTTRAG